MNLAFRVGSCPVSAAIIMVNKLLLDILVRVLLFRCEWPIPFRVPILRGTWFSWSQITAVDFKPSVMGLERCLGPVHFKPTRGPCFSVPYASHYELFLCWISSPDLFIVLEHSNWNVVHQKPEILTLNPKKEQMC